MLREDGRRIRECDRSADRAAIADRRMADMRHGGGDERRLACNDIRALRRRVTHQSADLEPAVSGRNAVEASRRNVEFGTGSEIDLLTAQNNYYSAIRAYSQTRYDYLTNVLTLKQQAGQLTERDLIAVDNLLIETQS